SLSLVRDNLKISYIEKFIGKRLTMLSEDQEDGYTVGHTENFIKVYLNENTPHNQLINVKITAPFKDGAKAERA
ncbi:MAG: hypothetical protein RSA27_09070, partial [Oscillospiraceae bacterium]